MSLAVTWPYPGAALVDTGHGTVLLGVPTEAFKATRALCAARRWPLPQVLVAPRRLLAHGVPQFSPEFFLYDALFGPDAAPQEGARLTCVMAADQCAPAARALAATLLGPSAADLAGYLGPRGLPCVSRAHQRLLAAVGAAMAPRRHGRPLTIADLVDFVPLATGGSVPIFGGRAEVSTTEDGTFAVTVSRARVTVDLAEPVRPAPLFALPPAPPPPRPRLGVTCLGARSGFDTTGPATGFVIWIDGRALLYDGPVGTPGLLAQRDVVAEDVDGIVLSHCHEDHMGAFVELVLGGRRPRVFTAEPIYRAALIKLASYLGRDEADVAALLDYVRIEPDAPIAFGRARLTFFYTVHAIPSLGVTVALTDGGTTHTLQISGDTLHHAGLDAMAATGVLAADEHARMRELVPARRRPGALYLADVGEALIHGHPADWSGNPNAVIYYHCADSAALRAHGRPLAQSGATYTVLAAAAPVPLISARVLAAVAPLGLTEPTHLAALLACGQHRDAADGDMLARLGDDASGGAAALRIVVAGTAVALGPDDAGFVSLPPGSCFGAFAHVDGAGRMARTVQAVGAVSLWIIGADDLARILGPGAGATLLATLRRTLPALERAPVLAGLDLRARAALACVATWQEWPAGARAPHGDDALYLVTEGRVGLLGRLGAFTATVAAPHAYNHAAVAAGAQVTAGPAGPAGPADPAGPAGAQVSAGAAGAQVSAGTAAAAAAAAKASAGATAQTPVRLLRLPGAAVRAAARTHAGLALALADSEPARP